jgi:hypothetical protein
MMRLSKDNSGAKTMRTRISLAHLIAEQVFVTAHIVEGGEEGMTALRKICFFFSGPDYVCCRTDNCSFALYIDLAAF